MKKKPDDDGPRKLRMNWLDPDHDRYRKSKKQEDRVAGLVGGKRLKRSGGMYWSNKWDHTTDGGDVESPEFLIEHKRTRRSGYTLKQSELLKVREGAERRTKDPMMVITFELERQRLDDWAVIPLKVLLKLLGKDSLE
jgi:hypothetical protein